ncbi:MAG: PA2778 family cysteine peptidase [Steroidobacteraceae bacterium]|nr:PA2778 family cysteine peptidase [Steroidobacteraceae bacterium]MBP7012247.1 PA2778 family cysteine peptidase [Steroidobacteraceae bacterium]
MTHRPGTAAVPVAPVSRARAWAVLALLLVLLLLVGCAGPSRLAQLPTGLPERVELTATPFHPQTEHQCGPAALATVLGAAGHDVDPTTLATEVYLPGRKGSLQPELAAAARARGLLVYEAGPLLSDLLAEVAAGRPVLVLQQLGAGPWPSWHYAVVIGYDKERGKLLLRSGTEQRQALRASLFEATWDRGGNWGLVLLEPGTMPAQPDAARYMSAAAALETAGNPAAAKAAYVAAADRWPRAPLPRLGLGNLAAAVGDWAEAERWYRAVLADDPTQAAALNNRAEALLQLGCPVAARLLLQQGTVHVAADDPLQPVLQQTVRDLSDQIEAVPADAAAECAQFTLR